MSEPMTETYWSVLHPTKPGWYWWKQGERVEPALVEDNGCGGLQVAWVGKEMRWQQYQWQDKGWEWKPMSVSDHDNVGDKQ